MTAHYVNRDAALCNIPGLGLHTDFVSLAEEQASPKVPDIKSCDAAEKELSFDLSLLFTCVTNSLPLWVSTDMSVSRLRCNMILAIHAQDLLQEVKAGPWETLARRRVQHFGFKFEYVVCSRAALKFQGAS